MFNVTASGDTLKFEQAADPATEGTDDVNLAGLSVGLTGGTAAVMDTAPTVNAAAATEGTAGTPATFDITVASAGSVSAGNTVKMNLTIGGETFSVESAAAAGDITTANDIAALFTR